LHFELDKEIGFKDIFEMACGYCPYSTEAIVGISFKKTVPFIIPIITVKASLDGSFKKSLPKNPGGNGVFCNLCRNRYDINRCMLTFSSGGPRMQGFTETLETPIRKKGLKDGTKKNDHNHVGPIYGFDICPHRCSQTPRTRSAE
jgi:hypothetical protein